jgi:hypothetical protein
MKLISVDYFTVLKNSIIGVAEITPNPFEVLHKTYHSNFGLYKVENEAPTGRFNAKIKDGKLILADGKTYGIMKFNLGEQHLLSFEPTSTYKSFGDGYVKEVALDKLPSEEVRRGAFFILSNQPGPKDWTLSVYENGKLDFGEEIDASHLYDPTIETE